MERLLSYWIVLVQVDHNDVNVCNAEEKPETPVGCTMEHDLLEFDTQEAGNPRQKRLHIHIDLAQTTQ
jgi:hypothetical protein